MKRKLTVILHFPNHLSPLLIREPLQETERSGHPLQFTSLSWAGWFPRKGHFSTVFTCHLQPQDSPPEPKMQKSPEGPQLRGPRRLYEICHYTESMSVLYHLSSDSSSHQQVQIPPPPCHSISLSHSEDGEHIPL